MKIVIGCPIKDRAWCLPEWFDSIDKQNVPVQIVCVYSESDDDTLKILDDNGVTVIEDERPGRSLTEIDGHLWGNTDTYQYMADLRNGLMDVVKAMGASHFFSLDSDIILPKDGLKRLMEYAETHPGVISPGVNMARNATAWNVMSWVDPRTPRLAHRGGTPVGGKADVIMAAMLLDRHAMTAQWESHSQGEDIGYCLDAEAVGVDRWWVPEINCMHLMQKF